MLEVCKDSTLRYKGGFFFPMSMHQQWTFPNISVIHSSFTIISKPKEDKGCSIHIHLEEGRVYQRIMILSASYHSSSSQNALPFLASLVPPLHPLLFIILQPCRPSFSPTSPFISVITAYPRHLDVTQNFPLPLSSFGKIMIIRIRYSCMKPRQHSCNKIKFLMRSAFFGLKKL